MPVSATGASLMMMRRWLGSVELVEVGAEAVDQGVGVADALHVRTKNNNNNNKTNPVLVSF